MRKGWRNKTLGNFCALHYGKGIAQKDYCTEGSTCIYGTGGLIGRTNLSPQSIGPSIIIGRKGSINSPLFINRGKSFRVIDTAYYLETKEDIRFVYYLIESINLSKWNEASGVPSLNRETFYQIKTNLPPLPEQRKIDRLQPPKHFTCHPVLIHVNGVTEKVEESGYFSKIIDFTRFLEEQVKINLLSA